MMLCPTSGSVDHDPHPLTAKGSRVVGDFANTRQHPMVSLDGSFHKPPTFAVGLVVEVGDRRLILVQHTFVRRND
jgi:hypothetical protein